MKRCSKCGLDKPLADYPSNPRYRDGHIGVCRRCTYDARNARRAGGNRTDRSRVRNLSTVLVGRARRRAAQAGISFSITAQDITIPEFCPCLGIRLERGKGTHCAGSPSIDRLDATRGYEPGNVWVISRRANVIKHDATIGELRAIADAAEARLRN